MRKVKKSLALLLATVLTMSMLTGCGSKKEAPAASETTATEAPAADDSAAAATEAPAADEQTEAPAAESTEPVTIRVNTMMGGTDSAAPVFQELVKQFMVDNPHITVEDESQVVSEETKAALIADFTLDNEPDIMQFFSDATSNDIIKMGKVVPVSEMQEYNPEIAANISEKALAATASPVDGVTYAIPTTGFAEGLFVNTDLFEQYNLELPTDWDKFMTAVETFEKNGIIPLAISLNKEPHYLVDHLMMRTAGLDGWAMIPETAPAEWAEGLGYLKTLRDMNAFPKDTDTIDNATAQELFRSKKAAMSLDGSWAAGGIPEENLPTTQFIKFPTTPNGKSNENEGITGYTSGFFISRKAWDDPAKRDACVKFLLAATGTDAVKGYWKATGAALCSVEIDDAEKAELNSINQQIVEAANSFTKAACPTDARIAGEPWASLINSAVGISKGSVKPEDAINEMLNLYKQNNQ